MCDDRERLIGYVYDDCDSDERRTIEAHLASCPECRHEIAGLRSVRQDLLAWDVPDHDSVWRPFAAPRPAFAWNQVPAWAMAAAAGVILLAGAAGGVATHALLSPDTPTQVATMTASPTAVPAGVSSADLQALERRLLVAVRAEMDERVRLAASHSPGAVQTAGAGANDADLMRRLTAANQQISSLQEQVNDVRRRQLESMQSVDWEVKRLNSNMRGIVQVSQQGAGFGVR